MEREYRFAMRFFPPILWVPIEVIQYPGSCFLEKDDCFHIYKYMDLKVNGLNPGASVNVCEG